MRTPGDTHIYQGIPFEELLERARAGDRGAFEELFRRSRPLVEKWALWRLGRERVGMAGASDITQDTMNLAFRKFPGFLSRTEGEWNGWLRTILTNCIAESYRSAHQQKRDDSDTVFLDGPSGVNVAGREKSPSQVVAQDDECSQLLAYLSRLPPEQGEVFLFHHLQGLSPTEIAGMKNRTPDAIRGLLWRGLQRLQTIITSDLPVDSEDEPPEAGPLPEAAKAYLAYLRLNDAGDKVDREAFVAQHPGCATELRAMFALIYRIQAMWAASSRAKK